MKHARKITTNQGSPVETMLIITINKACTLMSTGFAYYI